MGKAAFAYWRKCDFQVHTPRDPNWTGPRPVGEGDPLPSNGQPATRADVEAERTAWATAFVAECISKGLGAVAVTDHHEMVMIPYIEDAIATARAANPDVDLWLFPGMELTARGGCQCLILFDSDLSDHWRRQIQARLGIAVAPETEWKSKGPPVTQLAWDYPDIGDQLTHLGEPVRGRFIILPNVSQGGMHTVLTDGGHADFRRMPYVGGYLDANQRELSPKNKARVSGDTPHWSARPFYALPTSDSRSAGFATLGANDAWIKLAEPTAEAIRQAFLGYPSRMCLNPPRVPSLVVSAVEIRGASILDTTSFAASSELNSIIGGRGCGKSSLLEYIAFGLGRSSYDLPRPHYSGTPRMHQLVKDTIIAAGGSVSLTVYQDGARFVVVRGPGTAHQPQVTYPNGAVQTIPVEELRALFPCAAYSQGELSEIGKQGRAAPLTDLLQFVDPAFRADEERLSQEVERCKRQVRQALERLAATWSDQATLRQMETKRTALSERIAALEKTLPTLSPEDQATINRYDAAAAFEAKRLGASRHVKDMREGLTAMSSELGRARDMGEPTPDDGKAVVAHYKAIHKKFVDGIDRLSRELEAETHLMEEAESRWAVHLTATKSTRDLVLERLATHRAVAEQVNRLKEQLTELTTQLAELQAKADSHGDPADDLNSAISSLKKAAEARNAQTAACAKEIERVSSGRIRAVIATEGDCSEIEDAIEILANKTGSQEVTRVRGLDTLLAASAAWNVVDRLRAECLAILRWKHIGAATGEPRPEREDLKTLLGDTERIQTALEERMDESRLQTIATAVPRADISLSYCDGQREISFDKASEGQRAAALLFMLLEQQAGPLIVDQPEGDLDNRVIVDLSDKLHTAKQRRQLFIASHNANIVVNGSSELVIQLEIQPTGQRSVDHLGAIDEPKVRKTIAATMEGGERAFRDRQEKYGY